jgi:hypothetical protein
MLHKELDQYRQGNLRLLETYTDRDGYLRLECNKQLVHRWIAYKEIYLPNEAQFEFPFSSYEVHHQDENKLHNMPDNLKLVTRQQHEAAILSQTKGTSERK